MKIPSSIKLGKICCPITGCDKVPPEAVNSSKGWEDTEKRSLAEGSDTEINVGNTVTEIRWRKKKLNCEQPSVCPQR